MLTADLEQNLNVCPQCEHHFPYPAQATNRPAHGRRAASSRLTRRSRASTRSAFKDSKRYRDRLRAARKTAGGSDAIKVGAGLLEGQPVEAGFFAFEFMGGSMGSVVGEKVTRVFERALERRSPP